MRQPPRISANIGLCVYLISLLSIFAAASRHSASLGARKGVFRQSVWGGRRFELTYDAHNQLGNAACFASIESSTVNALLLRGGAKKEKKEKEVLEDDEDEDPDEVLKSETIAEEDASADEQEEDEDEDESEEVEDEYDDEEEEHYEADVDSEEVAEFDEPLVASPMLQLYATFGVMILSKKIDLFNPTVVMACRFLFIGYLVVLQLFLLYVRIRAKSINDRTPVTTTNPLSGILQSQLGGAGENAMVKSLASSFLSSQSTALEYDLQQAKSMQSGLMFNMAFMWFLHFKMKQMQPLIINSLTGLMNMAYSPLFQVYVLGRNLERPFKSPQMPNQLSKMAEQAKEMAEQAKDVEEAVKAEATIDEEEESNEEEEEAEEEIDLDGEEEDEEDDDNESED